MEIDCENPWQVENIDAFNFLCCPECVFRSKEESLFQHHALENHPKSATLFHNYNLCDIDIKQDPLEISQHEIKVEIQSEDQITEQLPNNYEANDQNIYFKEEELNHHLNSEHCDEDSNIETTARSRKKLGDQFNVNKYLCDFCTETFAKKKDLKEHNLKYHGLPCQHCDMTFENGEKLRAHVRKTHEHRCYICETTFTKEEAMQDHVKEHKDQPCGYCGKSFEDPLKMNLHIVESHNHERGRKCFECNKVFVRKSYYITHKNYVHGEKKDELFKCETCEYTTYNKNYLVTHRIKCPNTESGARKIAERKEAKKIKYGKTYETNDSFTCRKCGEKFNSSRSYINHSRMLHGEIPTECQNAARFFCDKCPRVYFTKVALQKHQDGVHTEKKETVYKCAECDEEFKLKSYIDHYRSTHNSMPPDVKDKNILFCDKCPLYYFSKSGLKKHARTHGEDTKMGVYECQECFKKFLSSGNLKEHTKKVHLKITPFECDQCPLKFGTKRYMDKHKAQVHSKVKCDLCHTGSYNPFELKRHKAASHGIYPPGSFRCDQCPMFFITELNLLKHIDSHH